MLCDVDQEAKDELETWTQYDFSGLASSVAVVGWLSPATTTRKGQINSAFMVYYCPYVHIIGQSLILALLKGIAGALEMFSSVRARP